MLIYGYVRSMPKRNLSGIKVIVTYTDVGYMSLRRSLNERFYCWALFVIVGNDEESFRMGRDLFGRIDP
jgi:hypothetical protein